MKKGKVKQICRQLLIAVVVMSLVFPVSLSAKRQKRGVQLIITKLGDGQVIEGELLAVKEDSLLIMTSTSKTGITIDVKDINKIGLKRKSRKTKFRNGALAGALIFGAAGYGFGYGVSNAIEGYSPAKDGMLMGSMTAVLGALLTGAIAAGVAKGGYKTIQVIGKSPSEIEKMLKKLRKKARFKTGVP